MGLGLGLGLANPNPNLDPNPNPNPDPNQVLPLAEFAALHAGQRWSESVLSLLDSTSASLVAVADHSSPVNGGLLLLRPNRSLYNDGARDIES